MKIIEPIAVAEALAAYESFVVMPAGETLQVMPGEAFTVSGFASNVPENDYAAWSAGTYAADTWVVHNHHVWQALKSTSLEPTSANPDDWIDGGYTNRFRMFDERVSTATTNPESIEVSLALGAPINALAFFEVDAGQVWVRSIDPQQGVIFERSIAPVSTDGIDNWYAYFFNPVEVLRDFVLTGVPSSSFGTIEIVLTKEGGVAAVGAVVLGSIFQIGHAEYGSEVGITDYSVKSRNEFGDWEILERGYSKRAAFDVVVYTKDTGKVQRKLAKYRAKPLVWIGAEHLEATVIFGYYKDFSIVIAGPVVSDCAITVEGLN